MTVDELGQNKRAAILAVAARHGVQRVRVFGSFARGDARADSDLDFCYKRRFRFEGRPYGPEPRKESLCGCDESRVEPEWLRLTPHEPAKLRMRGAYEVIHFAGDNH